MSKRRSVRTTGARDQASGIRGKDGESLPRIGESREEIQRTLVETMRGVMAGRITAKQANRITHAANMQLHRLKVLEWLERMAMRAKMVAASKGRGSRHRRPFGFAQDKQDSGGTKGGPP